MKKLIALLLALVLVMGLVACTSNPTPTENQPNKPTETNPPAPSGGDTPTTEPAKDYPPEVTKPVTIEWWMTFGSGANYNNLMLIVDEFNKNNEWGITVNPSHQGSYAQVLTKVMTDIASGTNPVLITMSESGTGTLGLRNQLQDLAPYIERDNMDFGDFHSGLTQALLVNDVDGDGVDEILGVPYCRSVTLCYYNMKVMSQVGYSDYSKIPTTLEELVPIWKQIKEKTGAYGICLLKDPSYYQCGMIQSLAVKTFGKTNGGVIGADGISAPMLTDGTFQKFMSDWKSWCDQGLCWVYTTSDASANASKLLQSNLAASLTQSSGNLTSQIKAFTDDVQGVGLTLADLGATLLPGYGGVGARAGGGNLGIIPANHTAEEIDAAWKFVQYAAFDPEVTARSAINTGYVCTTKSGLATQTWKDAVAAQPLLNIANSEVDKAYDATLGYYRSNWNTYLGQLMDKVIADPDNTESIASLISDAASEAPYYLDPKWVE